MLHDLFKTEQEQQSRTFSSRALPGTTELVTFADGVVQEVLSKVEAEPDVYSAEVENAKVDTTVMINLIKTLHEVDVDNIDFLDPEDEDTLVNMLKSQQSKRSHNKSKLMTLDTFQQMMSATVCEIYLREILNKPFGGNTGRRRATTGELNSEWLEEVADNKDKLAKEIRNVQSKKSIAKRKADFSEQDEYWQQLLEVERTLKEIREERYPSVRKVSKSAKDDILREQMNETLGGTDFASLKASEAKDLLAQVAGLLKDADILRKEATEEESEES